MHKNHPSDLLLVVNSIRHSSVNCQISSISLDYSAIKIQITSNSARARYQSTNCRYFYSTFKSSIKIDQKFS